MQPDSLRDAQDEIAVLLQELAETRPVIEAAKAFRNEAAKPERSKFWRPPWAEMADLCVAVDNLGTTDG